MYVCWDGQEWEWPNFNESDLTPDNSLLTSVETDGVLNTSISADPNPNAFLPNQKLNLLNSSSNSLITDKGTNSELSDALPEYD